MARPRSEAQRGSVRPAAAMRCTHREMRCSAAVQAARYRAARRAAIRSAPCEIRPGENVTSQYLSHDGRPAPAARAAATAPFANGKIPAARPGRHSIGFRLVREENGNALPGDRAYANSSSSVLAARKSAVPKPSVKRP
jgi:hypothetical protein